MPRLAVLGHPVGHSRSPRMHAAALAELGIGEEWSYEAIDVAPAEFEAFVRGMEQRGFAGANVTIPHKEAALALADEATESASRIGAANTLSFAAGRIAAANTDASALLAALPADPAGARALVLGAGGAARAAVWALHAGGARVRVRNRTRARAAALVAELGGDLDEQGAADLTELDLLVNATAIGLGSQKGGVSGELSALKGLGISVDQTSDRLVVVDLAYGETETALVRTARERGATVIDGQEILARQGAESFEIWTGVRPPLATMRRALEARPDERRT